MNESLSGTSPVETPPADNGPQDGGDWTAALPDDLKGLTEAKGWKEPADALRSYQHLESVFGADRAGRTLLMPRDSEDEESLGRIYAALGRPEDAAGYGFKEMFQGRAVDQGFMDGMAKAMHEAGLSKTQAAGLARVYDDMYQSALDSADAAYRERQAEFARTVDPARMEMARRGFRLFGLPPEESDSVSGAIERALGPEKAVELFAGLGRQVSEDRAIDGAEAVGGAGSPAGARNRIAERMADQLFIERYMRGEESALAEMNRLYQLAEK